MKANNNQYTAITHTRILFDICGQRVPSFSNEQNPFCIMLPDSKFKLNNSWNEQMPQENRCEQAFVSRNGVPGISYTHTHSYRL